MDVKYERAKGAELDAAEKELSEAETKTGRQSRELLPLLDKVAQIHSSQGLYAKAELTYKRAVDILSTDGDQSEATIDLLFKLGMLYRIMGKLDDAEAVYLRGMAVSNDPTGDGAKRRHAEHLCSLAGLYFDKGAWAQSEQLLLKALILFDEVFSQNSYFSRLCNIGLASVCHKEGKTGVADEFFARAGYSQSPESKTSDSKSQSHERAMIELARLYYAQGRFNEFDQLLWSVLFSDEEKLWPDHPRVGTFLNDRGELFRAQGQWEEAEHAYRSALEIRLKILGDAHEEVGATAMNLGIMLLAQDRLVEAEPVLKLALKTRVRAFGVEHPSVAACIETYSVLLKKTKRMPIAQKLDARARDIRSKLVWQSERATAASSRTVYPNA